MIDKILFMAFMVFVLVALSLCDFFSYLTNRKNDES